VLLFDKSILQEVLTVSFREYSLVKVCFLVEKVNKKVNSKTKTPRVLKKELTVVLTTHYILAKSNRFISCNSRDRRGLNLIIVPEGKS